MKSGEMKIRSFLTVTLLETLKEEKIYPPIGEIMLNGVRKMVKILRNYTNVCNFA